MYTSAVTGTGGLANQKISRAFLRKVYPQPTQFKIFQEEPNIVKFSQVQFLHENWTDSVHDHDKELLVAWAISMHFV